MRETPPGALSYAIAARVDFPAAEKQRILEERTEHGRLMVIVELLARGLENIAMAARIQSRAQANGKVAPPKRRLKHRCLTPMFRNAIRTVQVFQRLVQDDAVAVAARVAGRLGAAVAHEHDVRAAEVEVQPLEPVQALAPPLQHLQLPLVDAALAVEPVALDVDARVVDGVLRMHADGRGR